MHGKPYFSLLMVFLVLTAVAAEATCADGAARGDKGFDQLSPPGTLQIPPPPADAKPLQRQPAPPPNPLLREPRGAVNTRTGDFYPRSGEGVVNPRTGEYYPPSGSGFINPRTGEFYPSQENGGSQ